jgi:hypothetical protein
MKLLLNAERCDTKANEIRRQQTFRVVGRCETGTVGKAQQTPLLLIFTATNGRFEIQQKLRCSREVSNPLSAGRYVVRGIREGNYAASSIESPTGQEATHSR